MRTVIGREGKDPAGNDGRESFRVLVEPGETLRQRRLAAKPEEQCAACEGAAG